MSDRTYWRCENISSAVSGSKWMAMARYRFKQDRRRVSNPADANLISSWTMRGRHKPILDLDWSHAYVPSTSKDHAHLYLYVPIPLSFSGRCRVLFIRGVFAWVFDYRVQVRALRAGSMSSTL